MEVEGVPDDVGVAIEKVTNQEFEVDPFGAAMHVIRDAMNAASKYSGAMNNDEASCLSAICQYIIQLDPNWVNELPSIAQWDLEEGD
jgi:hypothetical protein